MKKIQLNFTSLLLFTGLFIMLSCGQQQNSGEQNEVTDEETEVIQDEILHLTTEFMVRGNCEMCKERIESALYEVDGVELAIWDIESKMLTVIYNPDIIDEIVLHETTAGVGHGTELIDEDEAAYSDLPECCQ